jgi:hypothetical protein
MGHLPHLSRRAVLAFAVGATLLGAALTAFQPAVEMPLDRCGQPTAYVFVMKWCGAELNRIDCETAQAADRLVGYWKPTYYGGVLCLGLATGAALELLLTRRGRAEGPPPPAV